MAIVHTLKTSKTMSLALALAVGFAGPLSADTLILEKGGRQSGIYEEDPIDKTMFYFTTTGGKLRLPKKRIKELIQETPAASRLNLGNEFFKLGLYDEALKHYYDATRLEPDNEIAAARLEAAKAKLQELQAEANSGTRDKGLELLNEARDLIAEERFDEALTKIRSAEARAGGLIESETQTAMRDLHEAWGQSRVDRLDDMGAAEHFEEAMKYGPIGEKSREMLLRTYERIPEKHAEVLAFYQQRLSVDPNNLQLVSKVADLLFKMGRFDEMTQLLLRARRADAPLEPRDSQRLHEGLMRVLRRATDERNFEVARDTFLILLEYYPESHTKSDLYYYEYYLRANQLDPNSYKDHFELGKYAHAVGLYDKAKEEYLKALAIDPEGEEAEAALQEMARGSLSQARSLAAASDVESAYAAVNIARQVINDFPTSPAIIEDAQEILEVAEIRIREHNKKLERSALDIANAGDAYYEQALKFIEIYQSPDYDDSKRVLNPANEAAANLERAINAWSTALQLDPSLAELGKGDLANKIANARRYLIQIRSPLPTTSRRREFNRLREAGNQ